MSSIDPSAFGNAAPATTASDRLSRVLAVMVLLLSTGFFSAVVAISHNDPGYFDRLLISAMQGPLDPIETGSTEKASDSGITPLPVPHRVRHTQLTPQDFQIVMVFGGEAHLASPGELWRVRVNSLVPGLGRILAIEPGENGGTVRAERATLTGVRTD
ncbi:MAG: hypothetical protein V7704_04650 [Aurantimonas endophytica]|uniref:hypothetical protein n=1 Tax=Aurantimonas endophytica TaxID=1522175 RepID=UPI003001277A